MGTSRNFWGKFEIKALFYEDSRDIKSVTIQRFTRKWKAPQTELYVCRGASHQDL